MLRKSGLLSILFLAFFFHDVFGQGFNPYQGYGSNQIYRSPVRKVLNMFAVGISSGYGHSFFHQSLDGFSLAREAGEMYVFRNEEQTAANMRVGYTNWMTSPERRTFLNPDPDGVLFSSDTASWGYRAMGNHIPLTLTVQYDLGRFRIGGGATFEFYRIGRFDPTIYQDALPSYELSPNSGLMRRFFVNVGYRAFDLGDYAIAFDGQFGTFNMGSGFNNDLLNRSVFSNLGVSFEKNYSEYLTMFLRTSVDLKNIHSVLGQAGAQTNIPAIYVTLGARIHYPEVPRCKIAACKTQLKHVHKKVEFRGQPIDKKQNPKYGENHPELLRYKGKNKKRLNPF
jgi:hypothetical protein